MRFLRSACHSVLVMRPVTHSTILTIIHDREKVGDVKDYQDHCFVVTQSFLWVGAFWCFLTSMYVHAFSSVKCAHTCFHCPSVRPETENVRLKKGLMGIANLLKGLRVIFEQVFGFMLIKCQRIVKAECPFSCTHYI